MVALATVLAALASALAGLALAWRWIRSLRLEALARLKKRIGEERVYAADDCNFCGLLSGGYVQMRGNGLVAVTERGIHFCMLCPRRYLFIPIEVVKGISTTRSFLGKWKGKRLLRVDFTDREGKEDACAFLVSQPELWAENLNLLISGKEHSFRFPEC